MFEILNYLDILRELGGGKFPSAEWSHGEISRREITDSIQEMERAGKQRRQVELSEGTCNVSKVSCG